MAYTENLLKYGWEYSVVSKYGKNKINSDLWSKVEVITDLLFFLSWRFMIGIVVIKTDADERI